MSEVNKQVVLIGWPIAHSLSPEMHNTAFAEVGLGWTYSLMPTKPDDIQSAVDKFVGLNVVGGNVTMPHKQTIMPHLSEITDEARTIGAVNTFTIQDGKSVGYNTDGIGFLNALRAAGHDPAGMQVVIFGAGGGARAAIFTLAQAGVHEITIVNRTVQRGLRLAEEMTAVMPSCRFQFKPLSSATLREVSARSVDLLVNATPVGMEPHTDRSIWPTNLPLPQNAICYDLIYKPVNTIFLEMAQASGHQTLNGLGMLVHHGVAAFKLWTGRTVSVQTLEEACLKALRGAVA